MATAEGIVARMSLEEKAALSTGDTMWSTTPLPHLDAPALTMTDGPHGVRRTTDLNAIAGETRPATCFPTASSVACTWDVDLIAAMAHALAAEAIALGSDMLLGPGVNMKRTPLCGRNFEYFSEDPFLAGTLATAYVRAMQSKGVGTSLKHFAANNQESERFRINVEVDERTLREIYLPAFEMCVKQAQPWSVMCAYNRLNGEYCSQNHWLLTQILKQEWGFTGFVVSDWGAVHDRVAALEGGLDLEMPGPRARRTQALVDAVHAETLDDEVLDASAQRVLRVALQAAHTPKGGALDIDAHHAFARRIAAEGMVLLKNNGALPLRSPRKIAVIGRAAQEAHFQGGGSSHIVPTRIDNPLAELQAAFAATDEDPEIDWLPGYPANMQFDQNMIDEAVALAQAADVALLYIALPDFKESEGYDRPDLHLTEQQVALIQAVGRTQPETVVILNNGSAIDMRAWIDDVATVLEAWLMGQAGGGAIADILTGRINPSGKLAETFPLRLEDTPAFLNFPGVNGTVRYGEGHYIGYRYYDARQVPVLFPFGHGLSYTSFAYSNLRVAEATFRDVDGISVELDVTNTGDVTGKEIVQLYVHDVQSSLPRPPKELKGFATVLLAPGETQRIQMHLDMRAFAFWHPAHADWVAEAGDFDLLVGASSADIRLRTRVTLLATQQQPSLLNMESTVREWLEDAQGNAVIIPLLEQVKAAFDVDTVPQQQANDGMDIMDFIREMPLLSLLSFQEDALPQSPEAIVEEMLARARQ